MSEKMSPVFLPPANEQGIQQFTAKDATIYIGREQPQRPTSLWSRCLMVIGVLFIFGIGAVMLGPKLERLTTIIIVNRMNDPSNNPLVIDSSSSTAASTTSTTINPTNRVPNSTIIYSLMNPAVAVSSYMQVATLYIAQDYQTTLSFTLANQMGNTYLDDVSVTDLYRQELLTNGDFESSTSGWTGAHIHSNYIYLHNGSNCHMTHQGSRDNISQTFWTSPGTVLNISFSLQWDRSGTGISHKVSISP